MVGEQQPLKWSKQLYVGSIPTRGARPRDRETQMLKQLLIFIVALPLCFLAYFSFQDHQATVHQESLVRQYQEEVVGGLIHKDTQALLRVPAFGKNYVMPIVDGTSDKVLDSGAVGRFATSPEPGGKGNYSLTAHRITHGEPFADLPYLNEGDEVIIEDDGETFIYVLTDDPFVVHETDTWVLNQTKNATITLITCASLLPTDDRTVVVGELKE